MGIKGVHHICIQTSDYKASINFYTKLLGFEVVKETKGFHSRDYNTWLRVGDLFIELQTPKAGTSFKPWTELNSGPVHIAILVDDVDATYNALRTGGWIHFKEKNGNFIYEVFGSKLFKVLAPEGTEIEVRSNAKI